MAGQGNSHSPGRFAFKPALPPFLTSSLSCRQPPKLLIPGSAIISTTNILCLFGADSTKRLGGTDLSPLTSLCNAEPVRAAESLGSAYFTPQKASCPRQPPLFQSLHHIPAYYLLSQHTASLHDKGDFSMLGISSYWVFKFSNSYTS